MSNFYDFSKNKIRQQIADILNINDQDDWIITDSIPSEFLYQVHYTAGADIDTYGNLRGTIVDIKNKKIVCQSFGYTPVVLEKNIKPELASFDPDGLDTTYLFTTDNNIEYRYPRKNLVFEPGFEGLTVRIFQHNNNVYFSTRSRIDGFNSRCYSRKTVGETYQDLNGLSTDKLFKNTKDTSCHIFKLVHPSYIRSTRQDIGSGYIVYLGSTLTQEDNITKYMNRDLGDEVTEPVVYYPESLSLSEANEFLTFGYYESFNIEDYDPRLTLGEPVIVRIYDDNKALVRLLEVRGPSYDWRRSIVDRNYNFEEQFYINTNNMTINTDQITGREAYFNRYPLVNYKTPNEVKQLVNYEKVIIWPDNYDVSTKDVPLKTNDDRLQNIWRAYLLAIPIDKQLKATKYYDNYYKNRQTILENLIDANNDNCYIDLPPRGVDIVKKAREKARQRVGENKSYVELTNEIIEDLLVIEEGSSLYRLGRYFNQVNQV